MKTKRELKWQNVERKKLRKKLRKEEDKLGFLKN
tara:strand:+ start:576 stop:677 length:102 start_codon:yes stop_codon:yes gene_type:complete